MAAFGGRDSGLCASGVRMDIKRPKARETYMENKKSPLMTKTGTKGGGETQACVPGRIQGQLRAVIPPVPQRPAGEAGPSPSTTAGTLPAQQPRPAFPRVDFYPAGRPLQSSPAPGTGLRKLGSVFGDK